MRKSEHKVLRLPESEKDWRELVALGADVYHGPEWLGLHALGDDEDAIAFVFSEAENYWVYPFVMRQIPSVYGTEGYDIESAYGYGGPFSTSSEQGFIDRANRNFEEWCDQQGVIAEFCGFHPLSQNSFLREGRLTKLVDRETISIDLTGEIDFLDVYGREGRSMVRRAIKGEYPVHEIDLNKGYERFVKFYLEAMERMGASAFYKFSPSYFEKLEGLVLEQGFLLAAEHDGDWAAASLFIYGNEYLHYHLSATDISRKAPGSTNLILHEASRKGRQLGLKKIHLGGGRTSEEKDSLLRFKKSMGESRHEFIIGKAVHDEDCYKHLISLWEQRCPEKVDSYGSRVLRYRML